MEKDKTNTKEYVIAGTRWLALETIIQKTLQATTIIVLARFLTPRDFGLIAIALMAINIVFTIKDSGINAILLREQQYSEKLEFTFFILNILLSFAIYCLIFVTAPAISTFFKNPESIWIIRIMCLPVIINSFSIIQRLFSIKQLALKKQMSILLANTIISGSFSIFFAAKGYGVWAIVYGSIIASIITTIMWYFTIRWNPVFCFSILYLKKILHSGITLSLANTIILSLNVIDRIFIGRFLGITQLGVYDFANRILQSHIQDINMFNKRILMPSFCKEQEDTTQLQSWYLKILQYCSFIVLPISLWLCFNMTELVIVVFGNSWISAIPMIQILSIAFPFTILDASAYTVYISLGKNFLFLKIVTIRLFATIITLIITTPKGLLVVCIWQSIIYAVFAILDNFIISKILAISWNKIKNTLTSSLLSALVFACLLVVIKNITQSIIPLTAILSLCLTLLISLTMWCGTIYILNRDTIFTIVNLIRIFITTKHKTIKTP